jgi:predicted nucleotidyltransferase
MKLRVKGLGDLDPLSVPLPHGTEVTTRVDRARGERIVPLGAIGRVVGSDEPWLEVDIVGVGPVRYLRQELLPRKLGQLRFAGRRAAAWEALSGCIVLEAVVGSHAWGLADERSDVDRRGVFAAPLPYTLGLSPPPEDLVSAGASANYWEVRKLVQQALRADPNTLEMLFVPSVQATDPIGSWILEAREAFVSREIYGSFGRYALSQLKKLGQSLRLAEHRDTVLSWLREGPPEREPTLDEIAGRLAQASVRDAPSAADAELRAKEYIKQLYRSMFDQGLLKERGFPALVAFARNEESASFTLPRELRPKNAYNLLRLIKSAIDWLNEGAPRFTASGAFKERLLEIKRGRVPLEEVIREAELLAEELEPARQATRLPEKPDPERADQLLRRIGAEVARRHVERVPGPFGASFEATEAPPTPATASAAVLSLTAHQAEIARRVLEEEGRDRRHLVVALSGAHAYGFPSPDSDLDLKAIHISNARSLLGLAPARLTADRMGFVEGVEIDYTSNEVQLVLAGVLGGNGNFIERILGSFALERGPELAALAPRVQAALSRRVHRHYHGFATGQQRELAKARTAKKVLYVLRTTLTGAHLLETGEVVTELPRHLERYGFQSVQELIERKRAGERTPLEAAEATRWEGEIGRAFSVLDRALERSVLPPEPSDKARADLEAWLLDVRRALW